MDIMSFSKVFKAATISVKSRTAAMIGNNYKFWLGTVDLSKEDELSTYPSNEEIISWMTDLFSKELAYKKLPAKALENMLAKGLAIKPQCAEILNIVITISKTDILVLVHNPEQSYKLENIESILGSNGVSVGPSDTIYVFSSSECFKEQDTIMQKLFDYLKLLNIYIDDDDSE